MTLKIEYNKSSKMGIKRLKYNRETYVQIEMSHDVITIIYISRTFQSVYNIILIFINISTDLLDIVDIYWRLLFIF